jgi:hypothetical protein
MLQDDHVSVMLPLGETRCEIEDRAFGSSAAKVTDDEQKPHGKAGRGRSLDSDVRRCLIGRSLPVWPLREKSNAAFECRT